MFRRAKTDRWLLLAVSIISIALILGEAYLDAPAASVGSQALPSVVINEIHYHSPSGNDGEEYIELHNAGLAAVDLSGWRFSDGILYNFPPGVIIPPDGYLVIGNDPAAVEEAYGISQVLGPFEIGRLANGGERLALEAADGRVIDKVTYDDHTPWPESPDGRGVSLELIRPELDNTRPCSWARSYSAGTPGAQNSRYSTDNIPPCVTNVAHSPVFPRASQPVQVTALVSDDEALAGVTLHYRPQGESDYLELPMVDNGMRRGIYTALIPPQSAGKYVEFMVTAADSAGVVRIMPRGAPGGISSETKAPITVSYLYLVEDGSAAASLPLYRLILTDQNRDELQSRGLMSDVLLDATFVYEGEVFYNVGLRYRGESSRRLVPPPYRIRFDDAQEFEGRERVNLMVSELGHEALTYDLFQRAGLPASDTRFVALYINAEHEGDYLDVESVDHDFLQHHFDEADDGNLYRGFKFANFEYLGDDPDMYRDFYIKKNHVEENDYTDVMSLAYVLTNSPDESLVTDLEPLADMRQWMKWFAIYAVLDNYEGGLWIGSGDDYYLYHNSTDGRFILIPWDHDSTFLYSNDSILGYEGLSSSSVERILNHPVFARWYYQAIVELIRGPFSLEEMTPRIDTLPDVPNLGDKAQLQAFVAARIPHLWSEIPATTLLVDTHGGRDFSTTAKSVVLGGGCSPLRDVLVNGSVEGVRYVTPTQWSYTVLLPEGETQVTVSDGQDTYVFTIIRELAP